MDRFAVFDIDGTLIRWQLYHVMVSRLAKNGELGELSYKKLKAARTAWKNRKHHDSFSQYEKVLIDIFESSITSIETSKFDLLVHAVIKEYKDQIYTFTRDLIGWLKNEGYFLLAISGSHHELVEEIAKEYKFNDWIGTKYEREAGKYSGKSHIASAHKSTLLKEFIKKHDLTLSESYAIGDSLSDAPMLEMVENAIAFNPDKRLFDRAVSEGWDIVIERKNVIYKLRDDNGQYLLENPGKA